MNKVTLVIDKKKIEFHLGVGFLGELLDEQDISVAEIDGLIDRNPFKMLPILMESSARYALYRKGKEAKYTLLDFVDMLDKVGCKDSEVIKFVPALFLSINKDVPKEDINEDKDEGK